VFSATDLLLAAVWWGLLTGLGEGWLASSYIWHDLTRAGVQTEPLLFAAMAVALVAFIRGRGVNRSGLVRFTCLFSALSLFAMISRGIAALVPPLALLAAIAGAAIVSLAWYVAGPAALQWQKRSLPVLLLLALWCALGFPVKQRRHETRELARLPIAAAGQPNVLVVVVDALRADHLSTYGYSRPTSPYLSQLAAEGTLFENAIAPSSWTLPVHASVLTGLDPRAHHVDSDGSALEWHVPVLSEEFASRGYRTAAFSGNTFLFCRKRGFGRGFIHFEDEFQTWDSSFAQTFYGDLIKHLLFRLQWKRDLFGRRRAADINRHALRWMDSDHRPFFIFLNYLDVHDPYRPPEPYLHRYSAMKHPGSRASEHWEWFEHLTPEQRQGALDAYDGGINYVDDQLHELMRQLKQRGLDRNTLVVITSDHGESFGEHGLMTHGSALYRELIHVPLILWRPGAVPAGKKVDAPVSLTALPATLLEETGEQVHPKFPQTALLNPATGAAAQTRGVISEVAQLSWNSRFPDYDGAMESITTEKWHYIHGGKFHDELFACCSDRLEQPNLANTAMGRGVVWKLQHEMAAAVGH